MLVPESEPGLGAVLLAAGGSSRLGRPKQLEIIDGKHLVRRQAELLLSLRPACTTVVTGAVWQDVARVLQGLQVDIIHHEQWEQGMGRSIACGIRAMPERVRGSLLLLCDQWRVRQADLRSLIEAWRDSPQKAAVSCWEQSSGPPVIFPRAMFQSLQRLQGDRGARQLLKRYSGGVLRIPMENAAFDLDVAGDAGERA